MARQSPSTSDELLTTAGGGHFGMGLFMGTVVGAIGMFLFGTEKGQDLLQQMREELAKQAEKAEPEVKEQIEQTRTLIAKAMDQVKDKVEQVAEKKPIQSAEFPKFKRKNNAS